MGGEDGWKQRREGGTGRREEIIAHPCTTYL